MTARTLPRSWFFQALVFLSAFLLFDVELIAAKLLLPRFGSSASVWTTSLVFFQGALLLGYLVAATATRRRNYGWAHVSLVMLSMIALRLRLPAATFSSLPPILAVTATLAILVGVPYVVLSTTSIVAQAWLHRSDLPEARDPAFLYGTSNAGSLLALLTYPLLVEPALDMGWQITLFSVGFAVFVLLNAVCVPRSVAAVGPDEPALPQARIQLAWLLLPAAGSALLMASTNALTSDASVPLLWVVPLTLYLLTWIAAFPQRPLSEGAHSAMMIAALVASGVGLGLIHAHQLYELGAVLYHGGLLTTGCLLAHLGVARLRPADPAVRGNYFLALSLGGFLGSVAVGVILPAVGAPFAYLDYVVAGGILLAGLASRPNAGDPLFASALRRRRILLVLGSLAGIGLVGVAAWSGVAASVDATRTFYGFYRVSDEGDLRYFRHGNTVHGVESLDPAERDNPLSYYHRESPVGVLLQSGVRKQLVGVVGLGAGALAAYARPGEQWDFYELDPEVERLARKDFHYLEDAQGKVRVIVGDARQSLVTVPAGTYDILIIDAFSSDFVPLHLISREAIALYLKHLRSGGLLVFHASSRLLDLVPVLARLASDLGVEGAFSQSEARSEGAFASLWLALSAGPEVSSVLEKQLGWSPLVVTPELRARRPWSDDYVNLFDAWRR